MNKEEDEEVEGLQEDNVMMMTTKVMIIVI